MAETVSPAAGRRYGVARVCRVWGVPRSSFYAAHATATRSPVAPARRGPKPTIADADLLAAIRADLARSPWSGEGHRKVWARLRVLDGICVARKRVLRLMRANALLSPHRARPRPVETHDRSIVTAAPNLMWATDATQVTTVRDGKVWFFAVAEHWNAEALDLAYFDEAEFAAYEAVNRRFGRLLAGLARPGDAVWIDDYHFLLMGQELRQSGWDGPIGFFLHIPFPAPEVFAALPQHARLARALAAFDLLRLPDRPRHRELPPLPRRDRRRGRACGRAAARLRPHAQARDLLDRHRPH